LGLRGTRRQGSGEDYITRNLMTCTHHQILWGDQLEKNEMGGACSTYGEKRGAYRILVGDLREGDHLGDRGVDGRIILKWIFKK
jgi:hypothetical protein